MNIYDPSDPTSEQSEYVNIVQNYIKKLFPVVSGDKTLDLIGSLEIKQPENSAVDYKSQLANKLNKRDYTMDVYGTLKLTDAKEHKTEQKKMKLCSVPLVTERGSLLYGGNEYYIQNQLRLRPGIYTRIQANGELETQFNLAKGINFKLTLDPKKQIFFLEARTLKFNLYALLHALAISDTSLASAWGNEIFKINQSAGLNKVDQTVIDLYEKITNKKPTSSAAAIEFLHDYFYNVTLVDPNTTKVTLGKAFTNVTPEAILTASTKLLNVMKGTTPPDERDSLVFKRVMSAPRLMEDALTFPKQLRDLGNRLSGRLRTKDSLADIFSSHILNDPIRRFVVQNEVSHASTQINPTEFIAEKYSLTPYGVGGISNPRMVNTDTRNIHPSHLGFIDPLHTPEGPSIGVTLHLTNPTLVDKEDDAPLVPFISLKTGKEEDLKPGEAFNYRLGFADEFEKSGKSWVPKASQKELTTSYKGEIKSVTPSEYKTFEYLVMPSSMFGTNTHLVPFLSSTSGPRGMTATKMITQSVALKNPEAPLVQVQSPSANTTLERQLGDQYVSKFLKFNTNLKGTDKIKITAVGNGEISGKLVKSGKVVKAQYMTNFPLNQTSFLHEEPIIKVGDEVRADQNLTKGNHTDAEGTLSLGKNMHVAYIPYKGFNVEDACVISESAAKKLSHEMLHKFSIRIDPTNGIFDLGKFRKIYPEELSTKNTAKLDSTGIIKVGQKVEKNDILVPYMVKREYDDIDKRIKMVKRSSVQPYTDSSLRYEYDQPGTVEYVSKSGQEIIIFIKNEAQMEVGDKMCYSEDTQLLTRDGWKGINNISLDDAFASINDNGELEYVAPIDIARYKYKGKMHSINTKQANLCVTPNHYHYIKRGHLSTYELASAENIFGKRYSLKNNAINTNPRIKSIFLPSIAYGRGGAICPPLEVKTSFFMAFLGLFISEGWVGYSSRDGYVNEVSIAQVKPNNILLIRELFDQNNITYSYYDNTFHIYSKQWASYFQQFGKCWEKYLPKEVFKHSAIDLKILFDWLVLGDGAICNNHIRYYTTSKRLADDFQQLCLHIGVSGNITIKPAGITRFGKKESATCPLYTVGVLTGDSVSMINSGKDKKLNNIKESWIDYNGEVFCPCLPKNHTLYTRRNGKCSWSGNSGRYGNKAIVSKIVPDTEMPHKKDGTPMEVLLSPFGVPARMSMGQMLETSASKIAEKEGKPFVVHNFSDINYLTHILDTLKKHKIDVNDVLIDPKTNKPLDQPVFAGKQYMLKLVHAVDKKIKARNLPGTYDLDQQPVGGDQGGQAADVLTTYALLSHGVRNNLNDMTAIKGQKNDEYWRALKNGYPLPAPEKNFAFEKMLGQLEGAGIKVSKSDNDTKLRLSPLTDKDILAKSSGEVEAGDRTVRAKDLVAEKGGLFDAKLFDGITGKKSAHMHLAVRIPNPVFAKAISSLIGINQKKMEEVIGGAEINGIKGADGIVKALARIDVNSRLKELYGKIKTMPTIQKDKAYKEIRYLEALKELKLHPLDAYTIQNIPVIAPIHRPIFELPDGEINVSPVNDLYKMVALINKDLKKQITEQHLDKSEEFINPHILTLYNSVARVQGAKDPPENEKQKKFGLLKSLSGTGSPKSGFIHSTVWGKRQDLSARSTVTTDTKLDMDHIWLPPDICTAIYKPFVTKRLVSGGMPATDAVKEVSEWTPSAVAALKNEMEARPVLINRAPSLHKYSILAMSPTTSFDKIHEYYKAVREGREIKIAKDIRVPIEIAPGMSMDIDGDQIGIHIPVSDAAVNEAWNMLPSKIAIHSETGEYMMMPSQDAFIGLYYLTLPGKVTSKSFSNIKDAIAGGLDMRDVFNWQGKKVTLGKLLVNEILPLKYRDYDVVWDKSYVEKLLHRMTADKTPAMAGIVQKLKEVGHNYAYQRGTTLSLTDFSYDKGFRDKILSSFEAKIKNKKDPVEVVNAYLAASKEAFDVWKKDIMPHGNLKDYINSKAISGGKMDQIRQVTTMPGILQDANGINIPSPIKKSWTEGQNSAGYWIGAFGARSGMINKSIQTAKPGELNKYLLAHTRNIVVKEEDCGTEHGIDLEIGDSSIYHRVLAESIPSVGKRNQKVDARVIDAARKKKMESLLVRSPLTCEVIDGVCQKCFGTLSDGEFPKIGDNVGTLDAQTATERSSQLTLRCAHKDALIKAMINDENFTLTHEELWNKLTGKIYIIDKVERKEFDSLVYLLSKDNNYVRVKCIERHLPTDEMVLVKLKDGNGFISQKNHPVTVFEFKNECKCHTPKLKLIDDTRTKCDTCKRIEYINQDFSVYKTCTIEELEINESSLLVDYSPLFNRPKYFTPNIPGYIAGFYTGDGCTWKVKGKIIALNISQPENAHKDIRDYFIKKCKDEGIITANGSSKYVRISNVMNNRIAERMSTLIPGKAYSKKIAGNYEDINPSWLISWLCGYIDTAGHVTSARKNKKASQTSTIHITTTSWALAQQLSTICRRLGLLSNIGTNPLSNGLAYGQIVTAKHQSYKVDIRIPLEKKGLLDESYKVRTLYKKYTTFNCYFPRKYISKVTLVKPLYQYEGYVYDIPVDTENYFVNNILYHNSFHTAGSALSENKAVQGFTRLEQLIKTPKIVAGKGAISHEPGKVTDITKSAIGGFNIKVGDKMHHSEAGRNPIVKIGDTVKKGQLLSEGTIDPRELSELGDHKGAQVYITKELQKVFPSLHRRIFETSVRGYSNYGTVEDAPPDFQYKPGDVVDLNRLKKLQEETPELKYKPTFISIEMPPHSEDWLDRAATSHIRDILTHSAATGAVTDLKGSHPLPQYFSGNIGKK